MFERKNKNHKIARRVFVILFAIFLIYFIFNYYGASNIDKIDNVSIAERETVDTSDKADNINVISNVTNCVVGVSKLKNTGDTVFIQDGTFALWRVLWSELWISEKLWKNEAGGIGYSGLESCGEIFAVWVSGTHASGL